MNLQNFNRKPRTDCDMTPQEECFETTEMVPKTVNKEVCTDMQKEVCTMEKINPRKIMKPTVKWWCRGQDDTEDEEATTLAPSSLRTF